MFVRCIGSRSSGNCHALIDDNGKILLLDVGITKNEILKAIDFRISDIVGAVVSHGHGRVITQKAYPIWSDTAYLYSSLTKIRSLFIWMVSVER